MERVKANREDVMSSRIEGKAHRRSASERPYLRPVRSLPPARPKKRRRPLPRPVARAVASETRRFDPLSRETGGVVRRLGRALGYWWLAALVHGVVVYGLIRFGGVPRRLDPPPATERVFVQIKEPKIEAPLPPAPEPLPAAPEVPATPPPPREKVLERAERAKRPKVPPRAATPEPAAADPVDLDAPAASTAAPRRKVVGISFESTVQGGQGPAFAVGNSRMGETGARAERPGSAAPLPKGRTTGSISSPNRAAKAIPTAGVTLVKPKRKAEVQPIYPGLLKSQGIEGNVVVLINIDATGRVRNVKVVKGSGYAEFDAEATKAAQKERFSPALRNGEPIEYTLKYTYRFRVRES